MKKLRSKKVVIPVIVLLAIILGGLGIWRKAQPMRPTYDLYTVKKTPDLILQGKINATQQQLIKPNGNGKLAQLFVHDGDTVEQGQNVYELTDNTKGTDINIQAQDNQATQTKINNLENELAQGQSSDDSTQADEIKNELTDAQNTLADGQLKYNELYNEAVEDVQAPIARTIHIVSKSGESGIPQIYIISKDKLIKSKVSEFDLNKLHSKQKTQIISDVTKRKYKSQITNLSEIPVKADTTDRTDQQVSYYQCELKDSSEPIGTDVHIAIPQSGIELPKRVVLKQHDLQYVYVYQGHRAHKKVVTTSTKNGVMYVSSGLKNGQRVVINPHKFSKQDYPESVKIDVN